ncbi:MAG: gliding motility-associated C-terminal domain-containing protein [Flavobacterium sp.]|uniref:T9SS type B sorting domain-containing protein n=1 Tax=Flavobacterium sp. TaxID=239 RepID=UPI00122B7B81|nr:gliding motility-associated C-terminal domain-containing protein [Flavobacterium sp.]RZJ67416.1 MAG: gliding motility-associated C-terminal domain-containing protein [Flavobacterium sp.]
MWNTTLVKKIYFLFACLCFFAGAAPALAQCPTIANTAQSFCDIQSPTVSSLVATNNGGGIVWYATATSTTPLAAGDGLVNGEDYFADSTVNSCSPRPSVIVTIYGPPTGLNFQGVCVDNAANATIANLQATGNNVEWYNSPGSVTPLPSTTVLTDNTIYYASQTNPNTGCRTSRLSVFVNVGVVPVPTGPAIQQFCGGATPTIANLQPSGSGYNWYATISSAVPLALSTPLVDGESYYATTVDPPCESINRLEVTVDIVAPNNAGTDGVFQLCENLVATTAPINLFSFLGGSPDNTGTWTGPVATTNGNLGTLDVSSLTVAGSPYVFTYSVGSTTCPQDDATVTITILPMPTATIAANSTICSGQQATVTFTGTPNATVTYTVNGGANQTILLNASGTATITQTYTTTAVYTLVSVASAGTTSCTQTLTGSITITVAPIPTATIASNVSVCSGQSATVTITGTPNATVTYTVNGGSAQTITLNTSGTAVITANYTTTTIITLTGIATTGTPSCSAVLNSSVTITVIQPPTAAITQSATVCPNGQATVTFTGTPNAIITYTVNGGANQTITLNASGIATITQTYTTTTVYTLVSVSTSGQTACTQPVSGTITITVLPLPTVAITSNQTICSGQSATVTFTGTPNATVTYTINNGPNQTIVLNASGTATVTNTYTATTTFNLISVISAGTPSCAQPVTGTVVITVVPPPTATISANATVCSGQSATVTFTGTPNAVVTYTVNGGAPQTITLNASGTATITQAYTATTVYALVSVASSGTPSCSQPVTGTITITVIQPPTVTITQDATVCSGQSATVTFTGTPNSVVTYTVNNGANQTITLNASGIATITQNYTATTIYTLVSISNPAVNGCIQPISGTITITVVQLPTAAISANTTICSGQQATVTFTGTPNAVVTYTVNNGLSQTIALDASGTATITQTYSATTTYTLVSASISGCSQNVTGTVVITVVPPPTVAISQDVSICPGASATVTFTGTPNATVTYTINNGPNQTIVLNASGTATITNTYTTTTVFTLVSITSSAPSTCTQPVSGTVTITIVPLPTVTISSDASVCPNGQATVTFTGTPNAIVTYTVNNGPNQTITLDASGTATITQNYTATTVYTLVSAMTSGTPACSQPVSGTVTITVIAPPTVTIAANATICPGQEATVTFTGTPNAVVTYTVNGGADQTITLNASGTATITQTYGATTVYTLVSASISGCSQAVTGTVTITVVPAPTASISADATICPGQSATVTFTGTPNAVVTYTINNGANQTITLNASGTAVITNTYTATTTFTLVSVTLTGAICTQPISGTVVITVLELPTASIAITGSSTICTGQTATITFTGTPNAVVTYTVNNGANQTITLDAAGTATISPTLSGTSTYTLVSVMTAGSPGCSQTVTGSVTVTVTPTPNAGNDVANAAFCTNSPSQDLFLLLGPTAQPGGTWTPALASGTGVFNPAVDAAGTYVYALPPSGTCLGDTASVTVTLTAPPNAGTDNTLNICSNADAQDLFLLLGPNAQSGGTWSPALASGTGVFNPAVDAAGTYTYTLTGTAPCPNDTATITITVTPGPDAGEDNSVTFCENSPPADLFDELNGTPQVGGTWSPALASGTGVFNPAVDAPGVYTYTFVGTAPCDNDTATVTVTINPVPHAGGDGSTIFCTNYAPADLFQFLTGTPQAGGTWTPALASGTGVFDPTVDAAGIYTYSVGGGLCATDTATVTVQVFTSPNAGADGTLNACVTVTSLDLTTGLDGTQGAGTFTDDNGSGALSGTIFNPSAAGPGTYQFTYTVSGGASPCTTDTSVVTVTVDPLPNAGTFSGIQIICPSFGTFDLNNLLDNEQSGGVWTDQNGITVVNPLDVTTINSGTYSFTYTIANSCGTDAETVQLTITPNPILTNANIQVVSPVCIGQGATVNFSSMADGAYTINYTLSGSNILASQTVLLTIAGGNGSITIDAANLPNLGSTTITFNSILNNASGCDVTLTGVSATFIVNPFPTFAGAILTASTVCFGSDVVVVIGNATSIPDGNYTFNYTIPGLTPANGNSGLVSIMSGQGSFTIPASAFASAGNYTITIDSIVGQGTACGNTSTSISANFTVNPTPNLNDSTTTASDACLGTASTVSISDPNIADGNYVLTYELTGANTVSGTVTVTFTGGVATFQIPATELVNVGQVTLSIDTITGENSPCTGTGSVFGGTNFNVVDSQTPTLIDDGEGFCGRDNPTIADLSANIEGGQAVVWYNAPTGGTAYSPTDLLVHGTTYYAEAAGSSCAGGIRLAVTVDLTICNDIIIPDGFSPNGDGINDDFDIVNIRDVYPNFKIEIYNRNGNILYKGNAGIPNWDGTASQGGVKIGSSVLPTGVYFWILEFNDGVRKPLQGRVYLNR